MFLEDFSDQNIGNLSYVCALEMSFTKFWWLYHHQVYELVFQTTFVISFSFFSSIIIKYNGSFNTVLLVLLPGWSCFFFFVSDYFHPDFLLFLTLNLFWFFSYSNFWNLIFNFLNCPAILLELSLRYCCLGEPITGVFLHLIHLKTFQSFFTL